VPRLLTLAGHDPVHGAGLTADLATWAAMGLDGASVVSALTVQNAQGFQRAEPVNPRLVRDALQAVLADGEPAAIKLGLLGSADIAREAIDFVRARACPVVLDPVLAASNGRAASDDAPAFLAALRELMRHVSVVTPNRPEAAALLGDVPATTQALHAAGARAVVLKGGHAEGAFSADLVSDGQREATLSAPRLPVSAHGTGCVFSAVLAGMLAQGWNVFEAASEARLRVQAGIAQARLQPHGRPHTHAAAQPSSEHLPSFRWSNEPARRMKAIAPLSGPLGFYAVVDSADWVERLLDWGVRTVQLRVKSGSRTPHEIDAHIRRSVEAGRRSPGAQVFINDHWQAAIEHGAYGVHLGQEDLFEAKLDAIAQAGLRLGVSTHTPLEMARAHAVQPSYVAIGPIYPTTLKAMRYDAVGLGRLRAWAERLKPRYPVVAIGGISLERAPGVLATGVDSIAVVSAVTQAADPREATQQFLHLFDAAPR
jgi:hydroxymethylpyrimidine kinase/phosphomethylpyrimidine kinase/thiamine-phosphate diphosphorylase